MTESLEDIQFFAHISDTDFDRFRMQIPELLAWPSYDDFVMERDGRFLGLSWAGENALQVDFPLRLFMRWADLTGCDCNIRSLDDFAKRRWLRAEHPDWRVELIQADDMSRVSDRGGMLYIPASLTTDETWRKCLLPVPLDGASDPRSVLAGIIAEECLDPAE